MSVNLPLWRSMLFVPANVDRFVKKAHERDADAIILDLEDSVPLAEKATARLRIGSAAQLVARGGADVIVRINSSLRLAAADLETAVDARVAAICIPKVSSAEQLQWISEAIDQLEIEKQLPLGHTRLIALVESVAALPKLVEIASSTSRLAGLIIGSEDFSVSAGMEPTADGLLYPNQQVVFAARGAGIAPLGFIGSIAEYSDKEAFRQTIRRSQQLGLVGGFCIHPDQVKIMNEEFSPSQEDVENALGIVAVFQQAIEQGFGAAEYKGKMIDAPVVARARELLALNKKIQSRG